MHYDAASRYLVSLLLLLLILFRHLNVILHGTPPLPPGAPHPLHLFPQNDVNLSGSSCCCQSGCSCACHLLNTLGKRGAGRRPKYTDSAHVMRCQRNYEKKFSGDFFGFLRLALGKYDLGPTSLENLFVKLCNLLPTVDEPLRECFDFLREFDGQRILSKNVIRFLSRFSSYSYYKSIVVESLCEDLNPGYIRSLGVDPHYVTKLRKKSKCDQSDFFTIRYPASSTREVIHEAEVKGLVEWAKTIVVGKSGSPSELYVCNFTKRQLHEEYLQAMPKVMEFILAADMKLSQLAGEPKNRFERNVKIFNSWKVNKGGPLTLTGRSYEKFLDILESRMRISFKPHPKLCKICAEYNKLETNYTKAVQALSRDITNGRLRDVVAERERELQVSRLHKQQLKVQRRHINAIRDSLAPNERLVVMDFVAHHSLTSQKFNSLVFLVQSRVGGQPKRSYFDFFANPNIKHDSQFFRGSWEALFEKKSFLM